MHRTAQCFYNGDVLLSRLLLIYILLFSKFVCLWRILHLFLKEHGLLSKGVFSPVPFEFVMNARRALDLFLVKFCCLYCK